MTEQTLDEFPSWVRIFSTRDDFNFIPDGFPILIDELTSQICQPALFQLQHSCLSNSGNFVENTADAYSQDLLDWMRYSSAARFSWSQATWPDLNDYVKYLEKLEVPQTGNGYAETTIARRLVPILGMYACEANRAGIDFSSLPEGSLFEKRNIAEFLDDRRKELRARRDESYADNPPPEVCRVLQPHQAQAILRYLGAEPNGASNQESSDTCVYHLAVDIGLNTGLRLFEIANLKRSQFAHLLEAKIQPTRFYRVLIRRKGGKVKPVRFHGYLIQKIVDYIKGERASIQGSCVEYLLVNSRGRFVGCRIGRRTLQRRFTDACIATGAHVADGGACLGDSDGTTKVRPAFTFHDLRHTFAVWSYWALKEAGETEPWKIIQEQLGHEDVKVTIGTYLAVTTALESAVSDEYVARLNAIASNQSEELEFI